jgi:hypothetical protein
MQGAPPKGFVFLGVKIMKKVLKIALFAMGGAVAFNVSQAEMLLDPIEDGPFVQQGIYPVSAPLDSRAIPAVSSEESTNRYRHSELGNSRLSSRLRQLEVSLGAVWGTQ